VGGLSLRSVHALGATWEFLGFVANSLIFLLIGIELDPLALLRQWQVIVLAFLASLLGRAVAVYFLLPWLRGRFAVPRRYRPVLLWGGLRGAVSLALVLSLPFTLPDGRPFPERRLLQVMAFGVVGLSLVLQGLTMRPLIARLGLVTERGTDGAREGELEAAQARLAAIEGQRRALTREHELGQVGHLHYERLTRAYALERDRLRERIERLREARTGQEGQPAEGQRTRPT
jgi:CPA1 family monovalent cation:H+ antiporter